VSPLPKIEPGPNRQVETPPLLIAAFCPQIIPSMNP